MRIDSIPLISALLLAVGLLNCGAAKAQALPAPLADLVARARAQIKTIDMAQFKHALDGNADLGVIIDVREPAEFASGHVPGAVNIPRGQIEIAVWPLVGYPQNTDMAKRMTLVCGSGIRCMLAARSLQELGFTNVVAVDMKIGEWTKAGYPLVKD